MKIFEKLKKLENIEVLKKNSINLPKDAGYLLPISKYFINQEDRILDLTDWRNLNCFAYPSVFEATYKSTKDWLENNLLRNDSKILFFILDHSDDYIGHIGLNIPVHNNSYIEIDNVSRGLNKSKGIMSISTIALINWSIKELGISDIRLKVLKSNNNAINFYKKLGFTYLSEVSLFKNENKDGYVLSTKKELEKKGQLSIDFSKPNDFFITMKYHL